MIELVVNFLGMTHQFLPQRSLVGGNDVSERLVGSIKGYRVGRLFRSHHGLDAGVRFAPEQGQLLRYAITIDDV